MKTVLITRANKGIGSTGLFGVPGKQGQGKQDKWFFYYNRKS